ncbi:hypothetical protein A6K25_10350 [Alteromonas stellipolaris]|uniref:RidA family protein n=1 Tax=Alteromonas stellipolaris TaxID=233316 RepID=UPI0007B44DBF|nr:RidA family protein [Alteromonas stellipolaris]ANB21644.1 hypothetical protein A6K25_10350 [Alteromonas stellipolaris]
MKKFIIATAVSLMFAPVVASANTPEQSLKAAGFTLPAPVKPIANYVTWRKAGNILYLSGHGACEGKSVLGKLGEDITVEKGYDAAQLVGLCALATIKDATGDLSMVKQVLKISGMVNATESFTGHSLVINGFSDIFVTAFGDEGKAARAAVGMSSLPGNMAVEVSAIIELKDE